MFEHDDGSGECFTSGCKCRTALMDAENYTPTTDDVREAYATRNAPHQDDRRREAFDRWLAEYARKAKAEALREAALAVPDARDYANTSRSDRKIFARWLRARADRIEQEVEHD